MSETWETFCDESYYHMWRVRKRHERGFNDGFHINNREEAIALCELLNKIERELAEAKAQLDKLAEASSENTKDDPHKFCRTTSHCGCRYNSKKP